MISVERELWGGMLMEIMILKTKKDGCLINDCTEPICLHFYCSQCVFCLLFIWFFYLCSLCSFYLSQLDHVHYSYNLLWLYFFLLILAVVPVCVIGILYCAHINNYLIYWKSIFMWKLFFNIYKYLNRLKGKNSNKKSLWERGIIFIYW
jgi:L-asparagine transporter-like permease